MALSDSKKASSYDFGKGQKEYNNSTDVFKWVFITETYASIDANAATAQIANYTKVASSGNYVQDTTLANTTWAKSGAVGTLSADSFNFAADPANPNPVNTLAIYNDTSTNKDIVCFVDLAAGDTTLGFNYTVSGSGIATTTTNT